MLSDDKIYRVTYTPGDTKADVSCYGISRLDGLDGVGIPLEELPDWFRRKLEVMAMMPSSSPGVAAPDFPSVGRRITYNTFWIYDGEYPGEESKEKSCSSVES